ncbi:MAG: endonuclease/exonuclease/phosphatase family protein [Bdellovibrionota bacterium]
MTIKVVTYNIHGGKGTDRERDYSRIGLFLKNQNVDIALIQEMNVREPSGLSAREILDIKSDHFSEFIPAPTVSHDDGWYGNAILSRYPVTKTTIIDISKIGREPRNILEVFIDTPKGPLHVINTHKGLSPSERSVQMRMLNELLTKKSEVPLIVGGDINQWHAYSGDLKKLNEALNPLKTGPTFPTIMPVFHLDRMWCRPSNLVQSIKVLKTRETKYYSDHYPLIAELNLP